MSNLADKTVDHLLKEVEDGVRVEQELKQQVVRLQKELAAWEKRFPAAGYDGTCIVLSG